MSPAIAIVIGAILALGGTIAACILIVPEKRRAGLNRFFRFLHDVFTFKNLIIEQILRVLYIFVTLFCVGCGFFLLFSGYRDYSWYGSGSFHSLALPGLLLMVLGPVAVRVSYEMLMMFVLLVKNTMAINRKLSGPEQEPERPEPKLRYCTICGTRYDANLGGCPKGCQEEAPAQPEQSDNG